MKPKILFCYANQFGYHKDSYKYCELLREDFSVTYYCFDQGFEKFFLDDINVIYQRYDTGKIRRLIHFYKGVIGYTKRNKVDIIFIIQFKFCFLIRLFAKSRIKILDFRTGNLRSKKIIRDFNNFILSFNSLFFKNITVISEGLRDLLYLNKHKTLILPLGGDEISNKHHNFNRLDLLYVGSLNLRNIHQTIQGVELFLNKREECKSIVSYSIIGFGSFDEEDKIRRTIEYSGMSGIVRFYGRIQNADLISFFDSCNIGVSYVPKTPYYNHQPVTKTFEYANSGLFTIATSTYENRKVITNCNGILCDDNPEAFALAIEEIYKNRQYIDEALIRSSLKNFRWDEIIKKTLKPYLEELLKG